MKMIHMLLACFIASTCIACTSAPLTDEPDAVAPRSGQMTPGGINDVSATETAS